MAVDTLPYGFARQHGVILGADADGPLCSHRPDAPLSAIAEVLRVAGLSVRLDPLTQQAFEARLALAYRDNAADASAAAGADDDLGRLADNAAVVDDLLDQSEDAPVVRLINALLSEAIKENASDIHIETLERRLVVRFRIDGILRAMVEPKRALAPLLVSRIKVMARLDIAEKRLPQDGRVVLRVGGHEVDVRVSTIPSQYGERVVMRLLDRNATRLGLDHLGMSARDAGVFARLLARPDGMLLVTGPTGSGKTTIAVRGARPSERPDPQHHDGGRPDRIFGRWHRPDAGQPAHRPDLCARLARRAAARPGCDHGGRNPRPGNRAGGGGIGDDRAFRAVHPAHQHRHRGGVAADRHGGGTVFAGPHAGGGGGAAAGAAAVPRLQTARARRRRQRPR